MAVKNRTEATSQVTSKIVPAVTNAVHIDLLNNDILNSVVFRKDVKVSNGTVSGSTTADFTSADLVTMSFSATTTISFAGLEVGDVKHIFITKDAGHAVIFSGATNVTNFQNKIDSDFSAVLYRVTYKDTYIFVEAIAQTVTIPYLEEVISTVDSQVITEHSDYSYASKAFFKTLNGLISLQIKATKGFSGTGTILGTLPLGYRPSETIYITGTVDDGTNSIAQGFKILSNGRIEHDGLLIINEDDIVSIFTTFALI